MTRPRGSWPIQRYLAVEILKIFAFVLLVLEVVFALFFAVVVARRYDLDLLLVLPVFVRTALSLLRHSVPLSLLFATALVFGRLVADREVMALKSFGLSYAQLVYPVLLLSALFLPVGLYVNGYVTPRMFRASRNLNELLLAQLRYLGEGWNRDFRFGDKSLWIKRHDGRRLQGIFLSVQGESGDDLLPEDASRRVQGISYPVCLFADEGTILFPEDIAAELADIEAAGAASDGVTEEELPPAVESAWMRPPELPPPDSVIFELYNVSVFFADEIVTKEGTRFLQRLNMERARVPYSPGRDTRSRRPLRAKYLTNRELLVRLAEISAELERRELPAEERMTLEEREFEGRMESGVRWAWTLTVVVFPLLAALLALSLNSANRLVPFFAASFTGPAVFYGGQSVSEVLAKSGVSVGLATNAGAILLVFACGVLLVLLERRLLR